MDAQNLPLSAEEVRQWWGRIELDRRRRKTESDEWQKLKKQYLPPPSDTDDINSNIHFRNIHLKCAELWAQLPELQLAPLEPLSGIADPLDPQKPLSPQEIVSTKRSVLNKLLGPDAANVDQTVLEALFDIFATSGIGATKICYHADLQPTKMAVPGPPQPNVGDVLGLSPVSTQVEQVVDVPVHEEFQWFRFSAAKLGIPHDWRSTDYDKAPYLFMEFVETLNDQARKRYRLPADFQPNATTDDLVINAGEKSPSAGNASLLKGVEVWLHAAEYDGTVANSQLFRRLVLIEGLMDRPAIYENSPYQTVGQDGRLTPDSMIGNPIHPITLRVCSDEAWIKADSAFTDPLVRQENTWASQDIKLRDSNIARFFHAESIKTAVDNLQNANTGQGVAVPDDKMALGVDKLIAPIPHLENAQSDVQGRAHLKRAIDETLGIGANQAGALNSTVRSATEVATVSANVSVRLKAEQNILLRRFLMGVRKFDALVQRYMTDIGYVEILGANGAKRLQAFDQHVLSGRYAYNAKIDSQLSNDPEKRQKNVLDYTNFMAKSAYVNQKGLAEHVTLEYGYDPGELVSDPPPPAPDKPNVSFRFSGDDLINPVAVAVMVQSGIKITAEMIQQAQQLIAAAAMAIGANPTPDQVTAMTQPDDSHGGAADTAEQVSEHHSAETGRMPGRTPPSAPTTQPSGMAH